MRHVVESVAVRNRRAPFVFRPQRMRLPDRAKGAFGQGRTTNKLAPQGRPSDIFGDVIVTVSRVRALEHCK